MGGPSKDPRNEEQLIEVIQEIIMDIANCGESAETIRSIWVHGKAKIRRQREMLLDLVNPAYQLNDEELALIVECQPIKAMKSLRDRTGVSLLSARFIVRSHELGEEAKDIW